MNSAKPRAPFARQALIRLSAHMMGRTPSFGMLVVHAGEGAWEACKQNPCAAVVLPPDQFPEAFDWGLVRYTTPPYHSCLVIDHGASHDVLARLGRCLVAAGARHVVILPKGAPMAVFKARSA